MQELYARHFFAALGGFDAVPDQDQPAIDPHEAWEQPQHGLRPQSRKPVKLDSAAVKVIEQFGVEAGPPVQGSPEGCWPPPIPPAPPTGPDHDGPHQRAPTPRN